MFRGIGVALLTLFDSSGAIDAGATAAHAERLFDLGVSAVIVAGTTGEPMSLTRDERVVLLEAVKGVAAGRPVIAGIGAPSVRESIALTKDATNAGADAVLALCPPGPVDPKRFYHDVVGAAADVPTLAYHFPAISAPGFEPGDLRDFGVVGVKDSSGEARRLLAILDQFDGSVYPGSPFLVSLAGSLGAAGAILAIANVAPELAIAAFDGDAEAQTSLAKIQFSQTGNRWTALKKVTAERFGTPSFARME